MPVLEQIRLYKYRTAKTCILYVLMALSGMYGSLPGVTLLDLQIAVNVPLDRIALILPSSSFGFIVGSIACGILVEFIDFQILLIIASLLFTVTSATMPWNRHFIDMCINSGINGLFSGFINPGGNTWILYIWGKESPAFLQAYHFAFGVGAFIAPLIAEPFLLPIQRDGNNERSNSNITSIEYTANDLKIQYPYAIVSLLSLLFTAAFIFLYCIHKRTKPHPTYSKSESDNDNKLSSKIKFAIIAFTCMFMFCYYGLELSFGQLLTTFVVNCDLKLDKSTASFMTSLYWATFTFFRLFTIFVVNTFSSQTLLIVDLILLMASNAILWPFGNSSELCLWISIALMGFGTSPIFACVFGFLQDLMHVSSKTASIVYVSCVTGVFVFPYIMGLYINENPNVFIYTNFACGFMMCTFFAILLLIKYSLVKPNVNNTKEISMQTKDETSTDMSNK